MNILYYGLSANQGGIETYLYKIARNIDKNQFSISYMDETGGHACFRNELEALGAKFYDITPRRKSLIKNKRDLEQLFSKNKFDVLHFNCNSLSYVTPILVAQKYGVKIVLHSRNSKANLFSMVLHRVNYIRLKYRLKNCCRIAVSDLAGQWMFGKHGKYMVINNGVEIERFKYSDALRTQKRNELNLNEFNIYGNVGAFLEAKNHSFILKIFRKITEIDEKAILLLVGDGPLKSHILSLASDLELTNKIVFLGKRSDVPELMMAMDCLLFPSIYEGFPNVILEAETSGLPIVMSDIITDEVVLTETCKKISLNCTVEEWAFNCKIFADRNINRENGSKVVEEKGYSVKSEIIKIEQLYRNEKEI